jgi:hypothetical protein
MPYDPSTVLSIDLSDLRTQAETQLRRIADAERHWRASRNGTDRTCLSRITDCLREMDAAVAAFLETCADAREHADQLVLATAPRSGSAALSGSAA